MQVAAATMQQVAEQAHREDGIGPGLNASLRPVQWSSYSWEGGSMRTLTMQVMVGLLVMLAKGWSLVLMTILETIFIAPGFMFPAVPPA
jgi:hypothetical protein